MRVQITDVGGVPTRCFISGTKDMPAVLLLHGLTLNAEIWLRNIDALGCEFHVVAPDMLGHGFSGPPPADSRPLIARKVEHVLRLADVLGLEEFSVCGSSYGGLISALLYFARPQQVKRLIVNGSSSVFNSEEQLAANLARTLEQMSPHVRGGSLEFWRHRAQRGFYDAAKAPGEMAISLMTSYAYPWAVSAWEQSISELLDRGVARSHRVIERLEKLEVETLILWGRDDPGAKLAQAEAGVKRIPRARLFAFEECGHFPMLEHPERFNAVASTFLRGGLASLMNITR